MRSETAGKHCTQQLTAYNRFSMEIFDPLHCPEAESVYMNVQCVGSRSTEKQTEKLLCV